ncbi:MAG TPA: GIY-YIG nuclease family protein [Rhizomicrobium sp.]|nr:GIY-YIG nuclease family protein [Rhizomicrobium sp.]
MHGTRHIFAMVCYVYVLAAQNKAGGIVTYVGWTLDLERRLAEHNGQGKRGAKSTRGRNWVLLYAEKHKNKRRAMAREYALKNDRAFRARLRSP